MKASRRAHKQTQSLPGATRGPNKPRGKSQAKPRADNHSKTPGKGNDPTQRKAERRSVWAQELAALAWGLAHPTRATILRFLLSRKSTLCGEIVDQLPLAQSTVSQHLKILRETGWVTATEDGPRVFYSIVPQSLARMKKMVQGL